jgi:hypothetical protein
MRGAYCSHSTGIDGGTLPLWRNEGLGLQPVFQRQAGNAGEFVPIVGIESSLGGFIAN